MSKKIKKEQIDEEVVLTKKEEYDNKKIKNEKKKKKKHKKIKINWTKVCVWLALIAMIGSALTAILAPMFSR